MQPVPRRRHDAYVKGLLAGESEALLNECGRTPRNHGLNEPGGLGDVVIWDKRERCTAALPSIGSRGFPTRRWKDPAVRKPPIAHADASSRLPKAKRRKAEGEKG